MQKKEEVPKRLLSVGETAKYLGISKQTIYNGVCPKAKERFPIPVTRVGRVIRFDRRDVDRFIEASKQG